MIHLSSTRSTSSSSSSSCGNNKNAGFIPVPNLTLYGSPAPRSVHRTSLGAIRARPRQKSMKPTTPPPSTPDLHLDLGSLAGSDSEYDCSARTANLPRSDIPGQQNESHIRGQHSDSSSSVGSPCHRPLNQKSCRKINNKSKVSQILFHNDRFERNNKYNSCTLKNFITTDAEAPYSLPFYRKNQHKHKYTAKKNPSPKSGQILSRTDTSHQVSECNSPKVVCSQYKECTDSNLSISTLQPTIEKSDTASTLFASKVENCFNCSEERHYFQKELSSPKSTTYPQSRLQQINADKGLISDISKKIEDVSIDSGAESYFEVIEQSTLYQNDTETYADSIVTGLTSKEEKSFQLLNEENKLLEEEYENYRVYSYETTINEVYFKGNIASSKSYELPSLNNHNDLCNNDVCTKDINIGKFSEQWFVPNYEGKRKYFRNCTCSKCHESTESTYPPDMERNPTKITENENISFSTSRENSTNCIPESKYDINRASDEIKEEEETLSSSQGSLGRERKNSDASWSSYHSSTYTTLSDSTWGCSSDTYESFHSEEICHKKYLLNTADELNANNPRKSPLNSPRSETNITASENITSKQINEDFEETRLSSNNEWSSNHFQKVMKNNIQPTESKSTNIVDSGQNISDEICPMKNASCNDSASQTRQSSSSGITGSITVDSSADIHHSSPEFPLQEFISNEKENTNKVSSSVHETSSEERVVEDEEEEIISTETSEELCLSCSHNLKACKCVPFPGANSHNNSSISMNNSDNEHNQNLTDSNNSFPGIVRNACSAPEYKSEYERRTKPLLQRLGCFTTTPDVFLSVDEVMEAAMYARQLVHVLEQALDRALSLKMSPVSEIASQSNLRRSQSVPEFSSKRSFANEDHIPPSVEDFSLNTAHIPKYNKWRDSDTNFNKGQENARAREDFTSNELFSLHNQTQYDQENDLAKGINICQEKCYCCGPKFLNISPQELQQQKALLRPVDKKPKAFTVIKDMASILKNVISHRRDIIVPPEDGAYYVSRSVSEWSIDE